MSAVEKNENKKKSLSGWKVCCQLCRYWDAFADWDGDERRHMVGWCRRYAPQTAIGKDREDGKNNVIRPITEDNDWCGDFAEGNSDLFRREGISIEERVSRP